MSQVQKSIIQLIILIAATFFVFYLQGWIFDLGYIGSLVYASSFALMAGLTAAIMTSRRAYLTQSLVKNKQKTGEAIRSEQSRSIEIELPYDQAFDLALAALESLVGVPVPHASLPSEQVMSLQEVNREIGRIKAGLRAKSFGITDPFDFSRVEILLQRVDNQNTRLLIESRSALFNEIYDLGRNLHYVNQLALFLRRESQAETESLEDLIVAEIPQSAAYLSSNN